MTSTDRFTLRAAVYLILLKDDQILLSRRFNTGWMDGKYSLIAGHIDGSESVTDAMLREAFEETGIKIEQSEMKPATVIHRQDTDREYIDFFFVCRKWEGEPTITERDKCDDLSWFPLTSLPDNTLPYIKEAIENMETKVAFSVFGW